MADSGKPRMVVIGGGITGAFAAYFLARLGVDSTLVERDRIAAHASGANAGGLNPLHGPEVPGRLEQLALSSLALHLDAWPQLRSLSQIDFGGRRVARLHVAGDRAQADELRRSAALFERAPGLSARVLSADEAREAEPMLGTVAAAGVLAAGTSAAGTPVAGAHAAGTHAAATPAATPAAETSVAGAPVAGALWTEGNARVDPAPYTRAVVEAARRLGAKLIEATATGLEHERGRVRGVRLGSDRVDCDGVVIATGPWCEQPQRWLGHPLPVTPVRGELLRVLPATPPRAEVTRGSVGVYIAAADAVWLGGTEDRAGFDARPTDDGRRRIMTGVASLLPGLGRPTIAQHTAALRPVTPDALPIVGIPAGWENVCLALGGGRKGMLLSTGIAMAASQLLLDGRTELELGAFTPARFARDGEPSCRPAGVDASG